MGKYDALGDFLSNQNHNHVSMTFVEIESVLGAKLPPSRRYRAWWSNNAFNNVMTQVWLDAGFETESVDMAGEKLVFRRVQKESALIAKDRGVADEAMTGRSMNKNTRRHPAFGCMKGLITIPDDVDLSEPADPNWAKIIEEEY